MAISPQRLTIYLYSERRAVTFAIAQLLVIVAFARISDTFSADFCELQYR